MPRQKQIPSTSMICFCESDSETTIGRANSKGKPKAKKEGKVAKQNLMNSNENMNRNQNKELRKELSCSPINVPFMKFLEPLNNKVSSACSVATLSPHNNLPKECIHLMENASFFLRQNNLNDNIGFAARPASKSARSNSLKRASAKSSKNNIKCHCANIPAANVSTMLPDFLRCAGEKAANISKSDTGLATARQRASTNWDTASPTNDANKESCTNYLTAVCDHLLESVQNSVSSIIEQHYCKSLEKLDELHNRLCKNEQTLIQMDNGFKEKITEQSDIFLEHCQAILEFIKQNEANRQDRAVHCPKLSHTSLADVSECRSHQFVEPKIKPSTCLPKSYDYSPIPERPLVRREKLHLLTSEPSWQNCNYHPYFSRPKTYPHKNAARTRPVAVNILNLDTGGRGLGVGGPGGADYAGGSGGGGSDSGGVGSGGCGVDLNVGDVGGGVGCSNKISDHVRSTMMASGNTYLPVHARLKCCCGNGERLMTSSICDRYNKSPELVEPTQIYYGNNEPLLPSMSPRAAYSNIKYFAPSTSRSFQNAIPMRFVQVVGSDDDDMYLMDDCSGRYADPYGDDSGHHMANYNDSATGWWQP